MNELTRQDRQDIKSNNLRLVLKTIMEQGPLSRVDIGRLTGISRPTVSSLADELIRRKLITELSEKQSGLYTQGKSSPGRRPVLLKFNSGIRSFLVFELGRSHYSAALADLAGNLQQLRTCEFTGQENPEEKRRMAAEAVLAILSESGTSKENLLKVLCISPGIYSETGKGFFWGYEGLSEEENREFFFDLLGQRIFINHSTKMALLGEKTHGSAGRFSDVLYIDYAYGGIGGALMINGQLYTGSNNAAGEFGYLFSSLDEFQKGHLDRYAIGKLEERIRGRALGEAARQLADLYPKSQISRIASRNGESITARTLIQAAESGDAPSFALLKESLSWFCMGLCNAINLLAPQAVILGGGFMSSGDIIKEMIQIECRSKTITEPEILLSGLKEKAAISGGVQYLIDHSDFLTDIQYGDS